MKIHNRHIIFLLIVLFFLSCKTEIKQSIKTEEAGIARQVEITSFPIKRGINISHFLSQTERTVEERRQFFTQQDFEFLSRIGYDHIRLPVDEVQLWGEQGNKLPRGFALLHDAVTWARMYNLMVIVDMHIIRSHYFNNKDNALWTESSAQDRFIRMWLQLSDELKGYSNSMVAYELLNEAVADDPDDWNRLLAKAIAAIRKKEPARKIIVGSSGWQNPDNFDQLKIPENDKNLILSFHFYSPHSFTHHQANWEATGIYEGPVKYPGRPVEPKYMKGLDQNVIDELMVYDGVYTRDTLLKMIQKPIAYAKKYDLPLYCGEFGALHTVPRKDYLQWYADVRYIFETNDIAWANWDYKGGFAIFDFNTGKPDKELIEVLLGPLEGLTMKE